MTLLGSCSTGLPTSMSGAYVGFLRGVVSVGDSVVLDKLGNKDLLYSTGNYMQYLVITWKRI